MIPHLTNSVRKREILACWAKRHRGPSWKGKKPTNDPPRVLPRFWRERPPRKRISKKKPPDGRLRFRLGGGLSPGDLISMGRATPNTAPPPGGPPPVC